MLKTIEAPLGKVAITLVQTLSYAATGNVVQIQALLREATDHLDPEKESDLHQAMAVIGVALIAMGEEVGSQMSVRHFNHLVSEWLSLHVILDAPAEVLTRTRNCVQMHYGSPVVRRAVPLALGLISASNPVLSILETLSRY